MNRPIVGIFSEPNALAISLLENFLGNFCSVFIFSANQKGWQEKTSHIKDTAHFIIKEKPDGQENFNYIVSVDLSARANLDKKSKEVLKLTKDFQSKTFLVLDYRNYLPYKFDSLKNLGVGIIYISDLLGPRMDLNENTNLGRILAAVLKRKPVEVSPSEFLYPISLGDTARLLVKWIFSFGPYGEEMLVASRPISSCDFAKILSEFTPLTNKEKDLYSQPQPRITSYVLETNVAEEIKRTLNWFSAPEKIIISKSGDLQFEQRQKTHVRFKKWLLFLGLIALSLSPYLGLAVSAGGAYVGLKEVLSGNTQNARRLFTLSGNVSALVERESGLFAKIPLVGLGYKPANFYSGVVSRVDVLGIQAVDTGYKLNSLVAGIFGDSDYDVAGISNDIASGFDQIYKELSFLQADTQNYKGPYRDILNGNQVITNLDDYKEKTLQFKNIALALPEVLGAAQSGAHKKSYLVLLQNNMELRPTGGFIGSFAEVSFEKGKLIGVRVSDVYSPDGQLKGHVEPPTPIKEHLGEAGWYLRDSNWDPDFPSSAAKAEWFLDKEIDQSYDGVFGVDLEAVRLVLKEIGPLRIADFDTFVDYDNLYETTQREVEEGFFPGSTKKTNFLTALSRDLLAQVSSPKVNNFVGLGKVIYQGFEGRHLQAFVHDIKIQASLAALGWDGAVPTPVCLGNCFPDWLGIVEANVGINKANFFISRRSSLSVTLDGDAVKKELAITYEDKANPELGDEGKYKAYVRVLAPSGAKFQKVSVLGVSSSESKTPEIVDVHGRTEAGVLLTMEPGEVKRLVFSWDEDANLNMGQKGEYRLLWRKQAGTVNDPVSVNLYLPTTTLTKVQPEPSLTKGGAIRYNTNLSRDFISRLYW